MHRDDDATASRSLRLPLWTVQAAFGALGLLAAGVLAVLALWAPIVRAATRAHTLERRVHELERDNAEIGRLALALDSVEAGYRQLRVMVGADPRPAPAGAPPGSAAAPAPTAPALEARSAPVVSPLVPGRIERWPLDVRGYVTRGTTTGTTTGTAAGTAPADPAAEPHEGLDIAVPTGTLVRAAGAAVVARAGTDSIFGRHALLEHAGGYTTLYAHLARLVVRAGDTVAAGRTVGLSGNSGRSSAPHLHFEVRRAGRPVDPLTLIQEPR